MIGWLLAGFQIQAQGLPGVAIGSGTGESGDTVRPVARITNPGVAVGVQFEVRFNPLIAEVFQPDMTGLAPGLVLSSGNPIPGVLRMVLYSERLDPLPPETVVELPFRIGFRIADGPHPLEPQEVRFVDAGGNAVVAGPSLAGALRVGLTVPMAPEIVDFGLDGSGRLRFGIRAGPVLGVRVERSADLREWSEVTLVTTDGEGSSTFVEAELPVSGARFFRVRNP